MSLMGVVAIWWIVSGFGLVNQNLFPTPSPGSGCRGGALQGRSLDQ
ncbi:hypothetical protein QW131_31675 [Roseibium salinum]|nr:hypothetical protein [Roseibium salinum]